MELKLHSRQWNVVQLTLSRNPITDRDKGTAFREKLIKVLATITAAGSTQTYQKKVITNVVKPAAVRKIRTKDAARSKIVAIACSTGGPKSLQSVIPLLKSNMEHPVLVVQQYCRLILQNPWQPAE